MSKNPLENQITHILENFDFVRVHKAMEALDWEYVDNKIPTIEELKETAEKILQEAIKSECNYVMLQTGGFEATKHQNILRLLFCVEEWECCDEDEINKTVQAIKAKEISTKESEIQKLKTLSSFWKEKHPLSGLSLD